MIQSMVYIANDGRSGSGAFPETAWFHTQDEQLRESSVQLTSVMALPTWRAWFQDLQVTGTEMDAIIQRPASPRSYQGRSYV